ncbi:MAG TPA: PEGA domain-containing protein [Terriglobia bacterium]|nr:PEGA domain-containing protein [Terriglobia bacterium]
MRTRGLLRGLLAGAVLISATAFADTLKLAEGTPVRVRLRSGLRSENVQQGTRVDLEVSQAVMKNGLTAIPEGAVVWGAVQEVKKNKLIRFDIEGLRLPNLQQIKLRAVAVKPKNPDQDVIRIEGKRGDDVGASPGTEYTAYLDAAADVNVTPPPPPPAPKPVEVVKAAPELVTVQFFSDPMGADILIDGEYVGNTPSILKVTAQRHRLEFQYAGYSTLAQILDLSTSTALRTVQATLDKVQ